MVQPHAVILQFEIALEWNLKTLILLCKLIISDVNSMKIILSTDCGLKCTRPHSPV